MNNLKLYLEVSLKLQLQSQEETLLFQAFDIERNRLFFASSANSIYTTQLSSFQVSSVLLVYATFDVVMRVSVAYCVWKLSSLGVWCAGYNILYLFSR